MRSEDNRHRSHLPMPNTSRSRFISYSQKGSDRRSAPIGQLRPPRGAPNVPITLIDDAGVGASRPPRNP